MARSRGRAVGDAAVAEGAGTGWRPTRYGDAGRVVPPKVEAGGGKRAAPARDLTVVELAEQRAQGRKTNQSVSLTCSTAAPAELVATRDPMDRAHGHVAPGGGLSPACRTDGRGRPVGRPIAGSVPRVYPPACMTRAGVAHDSAFDSWYDSARELEDVPGLGARAQPTVAQAVASALGRQEARMGRVGFRAMLRGWTRGEEKNGD